MQQLTKKALGESLKKMLSHKTLDDITVVDIVKDCGVNRQTFYYHFQDIYDLLEWIFQSEAEQAVLNQINSNNWQECLEVVFQYLLENKNFITNAYRSIGRDSLEQYLYKVLEHYMASVVADIDRERRISEEDRKFICRFLSYAIVGVILDWINTGMKGDPHALTEKIFKILNGDIQKFL